MIQFQICSAKDFMSELLLKTTFDNYQCIEGEVITFCTFKIDGYHQEAYYEEGEEYSEYAPWSLLKAYCLSLIKGKKPPHSFKFVFRLPQNETARMLEKEGLKFRLDDIQGVYINLRFEGKQLLCTSGTATKTFSLDKSLEQAWDKEVLKLFDNLEIDYKM